MNELYNVQDVILLSVIWKIDFGLCTIGMDSTRENVTQPAL